MEELYEQLLRERETLQSLMIRVRLNGTPAASCAKLLAQSRKVDKLIEQWMLWNNGTAPRNTPAGEG